MPSFNFLLNVIEIKTRWTTKNYNSSYCHTFWFSAQSWTMSWTARTTDILNIISPLCNFDQFWNFDIFYLCKYSVLPTSGAMTTCPGFPGYCSESFPGQTCVVVCSKGRNNVPLCQVNNVKIEGYVNLENYYINDTKFGEPSLVFALNTVRLLIGMPEMRPFYLSISNNSDGFKSVDCLLRDFFAWLDKAGELGSKALISIL